MTPDSLVEALGRRRIAYSLREEVAALVAWLEGQEDSDTRKEMVDALVGNYAGSFEAVDAESYTVAASQGQER